MIEKIINRYQNQFNNYLHTLMEQFDFPATRIKDAMNYAIFPGGKRLRPLLVYLSGELFALNPDILNIIAASIELIHGYSLVHDDLPAMDDDALRRGLPTCHRYFDEATAILAGDGLQALAIEILFSLEGMLSAPQIIAISKIITHASGPYGMVSGQSLDLTELSQSEVSEKMLEKVHHLKTGKLISACCLAITHADNSNDKKCYIALTQYAEHLGIAFQIQDDYLDKYGNTEKLGKKQGSDELNNKTTYASLYNQSQLQDLITTRYHAAMNALAPFDSKAQILQDFTAYLLNRSH